VKASAQLEALLREDKDALAARGKLRRDALGVAQMTVTVMITVASPVIPKTQKSEVTNARVGVAVAPRVTT